MSDNLTFGPQTELECMFQRNEGYYQLVADVGHSHDARWNACSSATRVTTDWIFIQS